MDKTEKLIKEYEKYARENGFQLNQNRKVVENIVKALIKREERFGKRYCPCRRITKNKEKDKKIVCPCIWHKIEIQKDDHCLCQLFIR